MRRAFAQAGRTPQDVDFIELHATGASLWTSPGLHSAHHHDLGTAQGDPTEANWVGEHFQRERELVVGSVKGNIGSAASLARRYVYLLLELTFTLSSHLEITSFLASLCKVCGIFETGLIPPNVNLSTPNPAIRWAQYRLRVPLAPEPLKIHAQNGRPLVAMTSSGIGGANGHAVIEGPPRRTPPLAFWTEGEDAPALLIAGALSPRSASAVGDELLSIARTSTEKAALARIFGRRARSMTWRSFAVVGKTKTSSLSKPVLAPKTRPPIVFVFSGQGTQHFQS